VKRAEHFVAAGGPRMDIRSFLRQQVVDNAFTDCVKQQARWSGTQTTLP